MKGLAIVLLCVALALLIDLLVENVGTRADRANIIGYETDSVGGRYIYLSTGDVYHRRAEVEFDYTGMALRTRSPDDQENIRNWGIKDADPKAAAPSGPYLSKDRNAEGL